METITVETYLLLGSNLGNRLAVMHKAAAQIGERVGSIQAFSSIYETEAWGMENAQPFLNQVITVTTKLSPLVLLDALLQIENELGRERKESASGAYASRLIDLDILYYGEQCVKEKELIIPHPRIAERRFVLIPMTELKPSFIHPAFHKTQEQLLAECPDTLEVKHIHG